MNDRDLRTYLLSVADSTSSTILESLAVRILVVVATDDISSVYDRAVSVWISVAILSVRGVTADDRWYGFFASGDFFASPGRFFGSFSCSMRALCFRASTVFSSSAMRSDSSPWTLYSSLSSRSFHCLSSAICFLRSRNCFSRAVRNLRESIWH